MATLYIQKLKVEKELGFWGDLDLFMSSGYLKFVLKCLKFIHETYQSLRNAFEAHALS